MAIARGPALDLMRRILDRVGGQTDHVWTPVDFLDLAPRAAVDKALQRLVIAKRLTRVDRGLYYLARPNVLTGKRAVADYGAVINAVARRDQSRVLPDGLAAANDLGLTTAVPGRIVVLTDARLRPIRLGRQQIQFKAAAPSRLYWAGHPAMRIVQALYWLQDVLDTDRARIVRRLKRLLADPVHGAVLRDDLERGLRTLPIWMQSVVRDVLDQGVRTTARSRPRASARGRGATRVATPSDQRA